MKVKPAPGLIIRDPDLKDYLPDEGRVVPDSDYWVRRRNEGDVVDVVDEAAPAKTRKGTAE
ncbi:MAG: DUF2635 domain-containing protein [Stenotrophobium sp.]